jgi:pilus assembly protein Flp/PilA
MRRMLGRLIAEDDGQDLIEYALLAGFISLVAIAAVTLVGQGVNNVFGGVKSKVDTIPTK